MKSIISKVRKDENGVITHVQTSFGVLTKAQVITSIAHSVHFVVEDGEKVHVVDGKYIRSDANDTEEDNLGNLPTFDMP